MATIKAYSDFQQSKVLAEILPIETADMKWYFWKSEIDAPKTPTFGYSKDAAENCKSTEVVYLPCWSLEALMEILPESITFEDGITLENGGNQIYELCVYNYDGQRCVDYTGDCEGYPYIAFEEESFVDACYKMIIKLHELNLL